MNPSIPVNPTEPPGAILMDGLLQSFLLGTIVNQAFKYWLDSWNDSWRKRIFVTTVILLAMWVVFRCSTGLWVWNAYLSYNIVCRPSWKTTKYGGLRYHACHGCVLLDDQLTHLIDCIYTVHQSDGVVRFISQWLHLCFMWSILYPKVLESITVTIYTSSVAFIFLQMTNKSIWVLAPLSVLAALIMAANLYLVGWVQSASTVNASPIWL